MALEEADESDYWLDVLEHRRTEDATTINRLRREAGELCAILAASRRTALENLRRALAGEAT